MVGEEINHGTQRVVAVVIGIEFDGPGQVPDRLLKASHFVKGVAAIVMGIREVRVQFDRLVVVGDRCLV